MSAPQQREGRRLPAYGRELLDLRLRGLVPADERGNEHPVLVAVDNWKWGERQGWRVVVPAELEADQIEFAFCAAIDIWFLWSSRITTVARRDAILRGIARTQPRQLWVLDMAAPHEAFFIFSRGRGLELPEYVK